MKRQSEAAWRYGQATEEPQSTLASKWGKSQPSVSQVFNGIAPWTPSFEAALFSIVGDSETVVAIKRAAQRVFDERHPVTSDV